MFKTSYKHRGFSYRAIVDTEACQFAKRIMIELQSKKCIKIVLRNYNNKFQCCSQIIKLQVSEIQTFVS
jgi:hypothetical protein